MFIKFIKYIVFLIVHGDEIFTYNYICSFQVSLFETSSHGTVIDSQSSMMYG